MPTYACIACGLLFFGLFGFAALSWPSTDIPKEGQYMTLPCESVTRFRPVILVTCGWSALYYCFLQGQHAAAFWIHKAVRKEANKKEHQSTHRENKPIEFAAVKYNRVNTTGLIFIMDRSVGNLLEQTPPFLIGLWLHALVVSPNDAAFFGWLWLMLRVIYPVAFAHPSMSPKLWSAQRSLGISWISFVTWPSYAVVFKLLFGAAKACL